MSSFYKTKPGDTIYKIIEKNDSSMQNFEKLNDIKTLSLMKGQMVLVPLREHDGIKLSHYLCEDNDTINNIMEKHAKSYEELKYFNNLFQLIIKENQFVLVDSDKDSPAADFANE